ncbi:MAG: ADP-dependent glucokinase/phosphofructokinase [Patescibacteria group bacterium]|jgi:ADP-dependent phosphofructokinase/glucokinase
MAELLKKLFITNIHFDKRDNGHDKLPQSFATKFPGVKIQEYLDFLTMTSPVRRGETLSPWIDPLRVKTVIENMDQLFENNIYREPTNETMLFGSTSNIDAVSYLSEENAQRKIDRALDDAIKEGAVLGKDRKGVIEEIFKIIDNPDEKTLPLKVRTKAEVVGFVLRMFRDKEGGRIKIADLDNAPGSAKELRKWIENVFETDMIKVGGAAAQVSDLLDQIGEPGIIVHSQFASPGQIQAFNNNPHFLFIAPSGRIEIIEKKDASNENDPTKVNPVIERKANVSVRFEGRIVTSPESNRFIFLNDYYDKDEKIVKVDPIFLFPDIALQQFKELGIKKFFTTTPNYLQRYEDDADYKKNSIRLRDQFRILRQQGVEILYEFSGDTKKDIRYLRDVLKDNISSFSLNDEELIKLVEAIKERDDFNIEVIRGSDPMSVYNNAVALAKYLNVDRVHVHGQNIDICVRKNATKDDMANEVGSLMYAKKIVTEWIRGVFSAQDPKSDRPSRALKLEGYIDLLFFAKKLGQDSLIEKGYYQVDDGYSVAVIPSKWVYNPPEITTSSGDVVAIVAAIHALHKK